MIELHHSVYAWLTKIEEVMTAIKQDCSYRDINLFVS